MALTPFQRAMRLADSRGISLAKAAAILESDPNAEADFAPSKEPIRASDSDIRVGLGMAAEAPPARRLGELDPPQTRGPIRRSFRQEANDPVAMAGQAAVRSEDARRRTRAAERAEDEEDEITRYQAQQSAKPYGQTIATSGGDSFTELADKFGENLGPRLKKAGGGIVQWFGREMRDDPGILMSDVVAEAGEWLTKTGQQMGQEGADALAQNAPDYGKLGENHPYRYIYDLSNSIIDLAVATGASAVTRNPTVGAQMLGIQVFGNQYDDSIRMGRSEDQAFMDATFMAAAETIGEAKVIGGFIKPGSGTFRSAVKQGAKSEAIQEMVTGVLQTGYQKGVLNPDMTWGEAARAVVDSGILGAGAGSTIAAASYPLTKVRDRAATPPPPPANDDDRRLTDDDRRSPLENDDIGAGKQTIAEVLGEDVATDQADDDADVIVYAPRKGTLPPRATPAQRAAPPVAERGGNARQVLKSKIRTVESSGNDNAKNTRSSASGRYQFIDSTFDALYTRVYGQKLTPAQRAAVKNNPVVQERLMDALVADNEAALRRNGLTPTAGNLYLAHFLGHAGAVKALKNPGASPSAAVLSANPNLKGMTNADVANWAAKKMGGKGTAIAASVDPELDATIDYEDAQYEARVAARQAREDAAFAEAQSSMAAISEREETAASARARSRIDEAKANNEAAAALEASQQEKAAAATGAQPNEEPVFESAEEGARQIAWQNTETGALRPFEAEAVGEPAPVTAGSEAATAAPSPIEIGSTPPTEATAPVATAPESNLVATSPVGVSDVATTPVASVSSTPRDFAADMAAGRVDTTPTDPPSSFPDFSANVAAEPGRVEFMNPADFDVADDSPEAASFTGWMAKDAEGKWQGPFNTSSEAAATIAVPEVATAPAIDVVAKAATPAAPVEQPSKQEQLKSKIAAKRGATKAVAPAGKKGSTRVAPPVVAPQAAAPAPSGAPTTDASPAPVAGATVREKVKAEAAARTPEQRRNMATRQRAASVRAARKKGKPSIVGTKIIKDTDGSGTKHRVTLSDGTAVDLYRDTDQFGTSNPQWYVDDALGTERPAKEWGTSSLGSTKAEALKAVVDAVERGRDRSVEAAEAIDKAEATKVDAAPRKRKQRVEERQNDQETPTPAQTKRDPAALVAARLDRTRRGTARSYEKESAGTNRGDGWIARYNPTSDTAEASRLAGYPSVTLYEYAPTPKNVASFMASIMAAKRASPFGAAVYIYDGSEYAGMRLFLTEDGKSGLALKSDGDIVSVFSDGGGKVHGMLAVAIDEGGTKLDAFDTVLPEIYAVSGFKEVARDTWNEDYAPEGWDKATFGLFNNGEPDVVYMVYDAAYSPFAVATPQRKQSKTVVTLGVPDGATLSDEPFVPNDSPVWSPPSLKQVIEDTMEPDSFITPDGTLVKMDIEFGEEFVAAGATLAGDNPEAVYMFIGGTDATTGTGTPTGEEADQGGSGQAATTGAAGNSSPFIASIQAEEQLELYPGIFLGDPPRLPDTIEVDGVERPAYNADGQPIAATKRAVENFWRWFGDSKAVNDDGEPIVFYHGTRHKFDAFRSNGTSFFSDKREVSESYSGTYKDPNAGVILPVYLRINEMTKYDAEGRDWTEVEESETDYDMDDVAQARDRYVDDKMESYEPTYEYVAREGESTNPDYPWAVFRASGYGKDQEVAQFDTEEEAIEWISDTETEERDAYREELQDVDLWQLIEEEYLEEQRGSLSTDEIASRDADGTNEAVWIDDVVDGGPGYGVASTVVIILPVGGYSDKISTPTAIKSATENTGAFDPENPEFRQRRSPEREPDVVAKINAVQADVLATLREMGMVGRVNLEVLARIPDENGDGGVVAGDYADWLNLIRVSILGQDAPAHTTRHEVVHWMRANNVINTTEYNALAKWASAQPELQAWVDKNYSGLSAEDRTEEMVAEGVARMLSGRADAKAKGLVATAINRIREFVSAILLAFKRNGVSYAELAQSMATISRISTGEQVELSDRRKADFADYTAKLQSDLINGRITAQEHHYLTANPRVKQQAAWHGTPHGGFDRFDINYLGTGEGAQAFGWGLYFAQAKDIATYYREKLSERLVRADSAVMVGDKTIRDHFAPDGAVDDGWSTYSVASAIANFLDANKPYSGWLQGVANKQFNEYDKAIADNEKIIADLEGNTSRDAADDRAMANAELVRLREALAKEEAMFNSLARETVKMDDRPKGSLYGVEIPETSDLLDLDKSLSHQPAKVAALMPKLVEQIEEGMGGGFVAVFGSRAKAMAMNGSKLQRVMKDVLMAGYVPKGVSAAVAEAAYDGELSKAVSLWLRETGIPGSAYLDSNSRDDATANTRNFVIFDDSLIEIRTKQRRSSPLNEPNPSKSLLADLANTTGALLTGFRWRRDEGGAAMDNFRYNLQDKMLPLLRVQDRVSRLLGRPLTDEEDAYSKETLYTSRVGDQLAKLTDTLVEPLMDDLHATKISIEELDEYLYARHAMERNAHVHSINRSFGVDEGSGMTNAEAAQILADVRASGKQADFDRIAAHVDRLVEFSIQTRVDGGLLSAADASILRTTYAHYVPLRGHEELDPADEGSRARSGAGLSVTGAEGRRAFGRESKANDLLGHVILQAEEAIVRAEKNDVAVAFGKLVAAHPEAGFWQANPAPQTRTLDPKTGMVVTTSRPLTATEKERTVTYKVDGKEFRILLDPDGNNETAMRLATAVRNIGPADMGRILQALSNVSRYLSMINTSYNPEFVISNALRDLQTASLNLTSLEIKGLVGGVMKDWLSMKPLLAAHRGERGKLGSAAWDSWVARFQAAGGKVHFNQMDNINQLRTRLKTELKRKGQSRWNTMRQARAFIGALENANGAVENAIRIAVFKNAVELGKTEQQAAYMAKNVTVNFNRHGKFGPAVNVAYVFANASIQGSTIMLQSIARSRKVQAAVAGAAIAGFGLEILNQWLDDEDEDGQSYYSKIPEFEKARNFILMAPWLGKGKYVKFPMTWGYNIFPGAGRLVGEVFTGYKSPAEAMGALLTMTIDAFNPVGGANNWMNFVAPTILDPVVDLTINRDFADRPIQPDQPVQDKDKEPFSQMAWPQTHNIYKSIAEMFNALGGGDEVTAGHWALDNSPESYEHISGVVTGAAGGFAARLASMAIRAAGLDPEGDPLTSNDIIFKRKVIGDPPSWRDQANYYSRMRAVEYAVDRLQRYREAGDTEGEAKLRRTDGDMFALAAATKAARTEQRDINKAKRAVAKEEKRGRLDETRAREMRMAIKERQKRLVAVFNTKWVENLGEKRGVPEE